MMRFKKISWRTLALVIAGLGGILVFSHSAIRSHKMRKAKPVSIVSVKRMDLTKSVTLSAELQPYRKATLYAKVAGYLKSITVDIGDRVKEGQIIATLENPEIKADFDKSEAHYQEAKLNYERLASVQKKRPGLVAQDDIDKAKEAFDAAKATKENKKSLLDYTLIKAPFDGIISNRYVDEGALIQDATKSNTQAKPVVDVLEDTKLRLTFPVPESLVQYIRVGKPAELTIQSTNKIFPASVSRFSGKVNPETRTMLTEIDINNQDLALKPGMYAYIKFSIAEKKQVLALPIQLVKNHCVWRVTLENKVEKIVVKQGIETEHFVEIIDGLNDGDRIVLDTRSSLKPGMKVAPIPEKAPSNG